MSNLNISTYHDAGFSTSQMRMLEDFLEKNPLHWINLNSETGIYELTLDNQMMSTFRSCPAHFVEAYVNGLVPKGTGARSWYLDFGILFHKMIEQYYTEFRTPQFIMNEWGIKRAIAAWKDAEMDFHAEHKEYKSMGEIQGFCGLLLAYAMKFGPENERLRVIGTEIAFGRAKEVPLGSVHNCTGEYLLSKKPIPGAAFLNCFLAGRIDVLVDDGGSIAPLDHKTMASFRSDPISKFELDEGPTGYVFAVNSILPVFLASQGLENAILQRNCNKIIMNFISKAIPKEGERFKRLPILKTTEQLEEYRLRMLATGEDIFKTLVRYASTGCVVRNTSSCTNWYMHDCTFVGLHRQNSNANEQLMKNTFFEKAKIWNTEEV